MESQASPRPLIVWYERRCPLDAAMGAILVPDPLDVALTIMALANGTPK